MPWGWKAEDSSLKVEAGYKIWGHKLSPPYYRRSFRGVWRVWNATFTLVSCPEHHSNPASQAKAPERLPMKKVLMNIFSIQHMLQRMVTTSWCSLTDARPRAWNCSTRDGFIYDQKNVIGSICMHHDGDHRSRFSSQTSWLGIRQHVEIWSKYWVRTKGS